MKFSGIHAASLALGLLLASPIYGDESQQHRVLRRSKKGAGKSASSSSKDESPKTAGNCLEVTLTGTASGPVAFQGLAAAGTLVTYGRIEDNCRGINMQFDMGRSTSTQLSKLDMYPRPPPIRSNQTEIDAIFFTHMHSDHSEDLSIFMQAQFHFVYSKGAQDIVCTDPVGTNASLRTCADYVAHISDAFIASGEINQRVGENGGRVASPALIGNVLDFPPTDTPVEVWSKGDVTVHAITTNHINGHASYRINTPAGSVVIGGDASNDSTDYENRPTSASDQVQVLASGADILVHSTMHPAMRPGNPDADITKPLYPGLFYNRQTNAPDVGGLAHAANVKTVMTTHNIPSIENPTHNIWPVPGGALTKKDYVDAVAGGGFTGEVIAGEDLSTKRLYAH